MIDEILPNLYRIEVPLPDNPLKAINSYVVKAGGQSLIIDTGMNRPECLSAISSGLKEIDVDPKKAEFFVTHYHADHSGLVSSLAADASTIYFSQADAAILNQVSSWLEKQSYFARMHGFPEDELQRAVKSHPGLRYISRGRLDFLLVKEGDTINIADYAFECIETPGHTRGHMCLYEADKKLFISGDHILGDITPNISAWSDEENRLNQYLISLDKVHDLDVELVLPGHRGYFKNFRERIQQLKSHHQVRADEVLLILQKGSKNAFQVASEMSWDMTYRTWALFPSMQKWFATGEAIAHLRYLEEKGKVRREVEGKKIVFLLR
ncbi:MAG: Hydroxyacylglutathione hydrolase GloC [Chloroflexi bacterium]|nr:Hydroxyacylglutathione hydrolase GloC [Chloroflexota bacterium]